MTPPPVPPTGTTTAPRPAADGTAPRCLPVVLAAFSRPAGTPVALRMLPTAGTRG